MADSFDVTGVQNTTYFAPGQLAAPGIEVSFVTKPSAIASSIIIPTAMFTVEEVQTQVAAQAAKLEQVKNL